MDIELRSSSGPPGSNVIWRESVPYSSRLSPSEDAEAAGYGDRHDLQVWLTVVVDGRVLDTDGEWHDVELRMAAHKLEYAPDSSADDGKESS